MGREGHEKAAAWTLAFDRWLTGVVFAVVLSALLAAGPHLPLIGHAIHDVEDLGVDAAMRARTVFAPTAPIGHERTPPGFVFVDMDVASCMAAEKDSRCATRSPATPATAIRLARAVLAQEPAQIVLDVKLWDVDRQRAAPDPDFVAFIAQARQHPRVRIMAIAPVRQAGDGRRFVIEPLSIPAELAGGEIQFAPVYVWSEGPIWRTFPRAMTIGDSSGGRQDYLSLPALAATTLKARAQAPGPGCRPIAPSLRAAACGAGARGGEARRGEADGDEADPRPLFSLDSQAGKAAPAGFDLAQIYKRYDASEAVDAAGGMALPPELVAGKTVIIGSSAWQAGDRHATPLGQMSGGEVLINTIRSFAADAALSEPSFGEKFVREATLSLLASAPFLLFWLGAALVGGRAAVWGGPGWARQLLVGALLSAGFLLAVGLSAAIAIYVAFGRLSASFFAGRSLDLFTPLVALSLEGFCHGASSLLELIETGVRGVRRSVTGRWRRWAPRFRRPAAEEGDGT